MDRDPRPLKDGSFIRRSTAWFAMAAAFFLAWKLLDVMVLAFAGVVVAVLLRCLSEPIRDHTPLNDSLSVVAAILVIAAAAGGAGWLSATPWPRRSTGSARLFLTRCRPCARRSRPGHSAGSSTDIC